MRSRVSMHYVPQRPRTRQTEPRCIEQRSDALFLSVNNSHESKRVSQGLNLFFSLCSQKIFNIYFSFIKKNNKKKIKFPYFVHEKKSFFFYFVANDAKSCKKDAKILQKRPLFSLPLRPLQHQQGPESRKSTKIDKKAIIRAFTPFLPREDCHFCPFRYPSPYRVPNSASSVWWSWIIV